MQVYFINYIFRHNHTTYLKNEFIKLMEQFLQVLDVKLSESTELSQKLNLCVESIKNLKKMQNTDKEYLIDLLNNCYLENRMALQDHNFSATANAYFILGYLKALMCSKIPLIDPVLKVSLKKKYCLEEIADMEILKANYELFNLVYSDSPKTVHAYCKILSEKIVELKAKVEKYEKYVAVRPVDISYKALADVRIFILVFCRNGCIGFLFQVINHAFSTILSPEKVLGIYKEIKDKSLKFSEIKHIVFKCASNVLSLENFINELLKYRFTYRDIVEPLLSNLMEYLYGFKLQADVLKHILSVCMFGSKFQSDLEKFVQFPTLNKNQSDFLLHIDSYLNGSLFENSGISELQRFR